MWPEERRTRLTVREKFTEERRAWGKRRKEIVTEESLFAFDPVRGRPGILVTRLLCSTFSVLPFLLYLIPSTLLLKLKHCKFYNFRHCLTKLNV